MGGIAVVLVLLAVGVLLGRLAGRSPATQYLVAAMATLFVSAIYLLLAPDQ